MYHTIHSQIVCRSVSDKIFNFQVHFRCMSLSSSPSWSSAPWTLWGQYFWSSIWIVYLIWGSGSLAVLHTYMEALVCWSVSDRIFNLQVHFWCLLLLFLVFDLCPSTQWGHYFMESHSNLVYFVCLIRGLGSLAVLHFDFNKEKPFSLWVSGARQYTKNSYRDLTPDLRQKWWWKYMPLKLFSNPTSPFRVTS